MRFPPCEGRRHQRPPPALHPQLPKAERDQAESIALALGNRPPPWRLGAVGVTGGSGTVYRIKSPACAYALVTTASRPESKVAATSSENVTMTSAAGSQGRTYESFSPSPQVNRHHTYLVLCPTPIQRSFCRKARDARRVHFSHSLHSLTSDATRAAPWGEGSARLGAASTEIDGRQH